MLALRRTIEEIKIVNWQPAAVFAVFSKAFDSVNRDVMFHFLFFYGLAHKLLQELKPCLTTQQYLSLVLMVLQIHSKLQSRSCPCILFITVVEYMR